MNKRDSINTNDSSSISSPISSNWGIKELGFSCSNGSINDEKLNDEKNSFEAILSFFHSKGVKAGDPSSICEDFMSQRKESIKGNSSQGVNLTSSSLLARRNRSLILN